MSMRNQIVICVVAVMYILVGALPASAHRPYFTQAERIVLPDGNPGELRLLHGDGILGPDPRRVLVLDADHRVIARSHQSTFLDLACWRKMNCKIFDFNDDTILQLDSKTFRVGNIIKSDEDDPEREGLWQLISGNETWGLSQPTSQLAGAS